MALNFPDNPTIGQQYTDPNNLVWEFNGVVWNSITSGISGFSGSSGYSGYSGTSGYSGISGISGFSSSGVAISVYYEGNLLTNAASSFNFAGSEVVATNISQAVTVTIEPPPIVYVNSAWTWGSGSYGELGDNTIVAKSSPVSVVGGFTDWCHISAGSYQKVAVRSNGTAWAWGRNGSGRLGDGTTVSKSSPVSVVGGFTNWNKVHIGTNHSVGLRQDGTLWAWGYNGQGQIGANNTTARSSPVSVVGGFTDWCQLWAGNNNSFGIRTNGVLYAWGYNNSGRLGINVGGERSSPVSVVGGFTDWCQVSGCNHTLAVRTNGTAWAWGCGYQGQLGNGQFGSYGSPNARSSPVSVVGGITDWCQVAGGFRHSLGVRTNGTLYSWGWQNFGQLGTNTTGSVNSPVAVVGGFTDWCQVATGYNNSSALRTNGTAWAWGTNGSGSLGNNSTSNTSSPVSVVGGFTDWIQITQAAEHGGGIRSTAT